MILNVGASYWPDADEVVIDAFATQNDGVTPSVPDTLHLDLLLQTTDQIGAKTLRPLNALDVLPDYISADKHFNVRFRAPQRRQDLYLTAIATFGVDVVQKTVQIGIAETGRNEMDLPDNAIFTEDVLAMIPTGGPNDPITPDNNVALAPPLRDYDSTYIFNLPQPVETYEDLGYSGGAVDRLMLNSQSSSYQIQESKPPWAIPAYLFMEDSQTNLMSNSFLLVPQTVQVPNIPQTWSFDGGGALVTYTLGFDHQTSSDAKIWVVRFRQNNIYMNFNAASLLCSQAIPVTGGQNYCFSTYLRTRLMTPDTVVQSARLRIEWYDGTTLLSTSDAVVPTSDYTGLSLALVADVAPLAADNAKVRLDFFDVDAGDDIECSLFAPQFEPGLLPSSRILTSRTQDLVTTTDYNAANQKIRFQLIPGFSNSTLAAPVQFTTGPLQISFDSMGLSATLAGGPTITAPVLFNAGDFLDLSIQHVSNGKFTVYRAGQIVSQISIGAVTPTATPIVIQGIGFELLQLNVFSRS